MLVILELEGFPTLKKGKNYRTLIAEIRPPSRNKITFLLGGFSLKLYVIYTPCKPITVYTYGYNSYLLLYQC